MNWLNALVNEYDAKPLQKAGMLTKDQLAQFFAESAKQFSNPEFKQLLSVAHSQRGPGTSEEMVNGMQKQIFESMGIQGDFGLKCLSRVHPEYGSDAFFMRQFYEHVQKEEMVLDEAEMPESMFRSKYETLNRFRAEMVSRMEKMKGMSPQDQNAYLANMYREMIAQGGEDCCTRPGGCNSQPGGAEACQKKGNAAGAPMQAPGGIAVPLPVSGVAPPSSAAMTQDEQLAFFSQLSGPAAPK
ncbi:hypothetical protein CHLRE_01g049050v5 [Chlamydomonas reinhardtii]|uniref:Uncharacterized protein n=1 Tax=Chlamydomonas reinhardtii TaxID=3055 RepID=A8HN96_CHLRE|nr:uncharacterized protein CHLRE_01g049050v5 [Chlamydomonas reinhardtii]PNW88882.1 hypothetical protein CHLRE_01g049050v5 [Chlamydomonas reinhardtii]|eukprot:XP_001690232.1 predicted protein [Chlamydomonas reinhardtii]